MDWLFSFAIGLGLSATCGFRVFVPLFGISLAAQTGHLALAPGFDWLAAPGATTAFGIATLLEVAAYYIPWVDNVLDTVATPAAVVAGTIITASMVGDVSPLLRWSLAVIAGGGAAGVVQGGTVMLRGTSTVTTAGLGNPILATGELISSTLGTILSIALPFLALALIVTLVCVVARREMNRRQRRTAFTPVC
jgi:hypothetical protein